MFSNKDSSFSKRKYGINMSLNMSSNTVAYSISNQLRKNLLYITMKEKRKRNHDPSLQEATILLKRLDISSYVALCHLHTHFKNI